MLGTRTICLPDCRPLLADPDDLSLVFQPVVDLSAARVTGFQALARFPGTAGPDVWFSAAADLGVAAELEALAIHQALAAVDLLPAGTFLTVHVSPPLLGTAPVQEALAGRADLRGVVVELTGWAPVDDLSTLRRQTTELRDRGAQIALADTGSAGLQQAAVLRPHIIRLGRALLAGADADPVRTALVETIAAFAGRIDARLLAEGLQTTGELAAVARLGIPLAQGWVLARPAPSFEPLPPEARALVHAQAGRPRGTGRVASLLRPVRQVEPGEPAGIPPAVLVGPLGEPLDLLLADPRTAEVYTTPASLQVPPTADISETLQRALGRPPAQRFDPVVCTDPTGAVLGLLRLEDLASAAHAR